MRTWWLVLISRSSRDSATTGLGNSGYQSLGARLLVRMRGLPAMARSETRWDLTPCVGHAESRKVGGGSEMIHHDGKEKLP